MHCTTHGQKELGFSEPFPNLRVNSVGSARGYRYWVVLRGHESFTLHPAASWPPCSPPCPIYLRLQEEVAFLSRQHDPRERDVPQVIMNFPKQASPFKGIHAYSNDSRRKEKSPNLFAGLTLGCLLTRLFWWPAVGESQLRWGSRVPHHVFPGQQTHSVADAVHEDPIGPAPALPPLIFCLGRSLGWEAVYVPTSCVNRLGFWPALANTRTCQEPEPATSGPPEALSGLVPSSGTLPVGITGASPSGREALTP